MSNKYINEGLPSTLRTDPWFRPFSSTTTQWLWGSNGFHVVRIAGEYIYVDLGLVPLVHLFIPSPNEVSRKRIGREPFLTDGRDGHARSSDP